MTLISVLVFFEMSNVVSHSCKVLQPGLNCFRIYDGRTFCPLGYLRLLDEKLIEYIEAIFWLLQGKTSDMSQVIVTCNNYKILSVLICLGSFVQRYKIQAFRKSVNRPFAVFSNASKRDFSIQTSKILLKHPTN